MKKKIKDLTVQELKKYCDQQHGCRNCVYRLCKVVNENCFEDGGVRPECDWNREVEIDE